MTLQDAVFLVTATPAKIIGEAAHIGSLETGKDADIILLEKSYQVAATFIKGKIVYQGTAKK